MTADLAAQNAQAALDRIAGAVEQKDSRFSAERWAWSAFTVASAFGGWIVAHVVEGSLTPEVERIGTIGAVIVVVMIFVREMRSDRESRHKSYGAASMVIASNTHMMGRALAVVERSISVTEKLEGALERFLNFEEAIQTGAIKRARHRPPASAPVETVEVPPPVRST